MINTTNLESKCAKPKRAYVVKTRHRTPGREIKEMRLDKDRVHRELYALFMSINSNNMTEQQL